jgi:dihydrodipicolinate synthase/N-acetylneuraminate lyase
LDALAALVRFQISKGVDGLYPCGSTGLGPMLSPEERRQVAETVIRTASRKVPVVVQVGCADTDSAVKLARHAEDAGADAVASLTPYYYKPGAESVARHFERVARSVEIPLLAYNIPQFTGNNLMPREVAALAEAGTISGVKDSSRDFLQLLDVIKSTPDSFVVMNGTEEYALFAMLMGADGVVSGGANAFPEVFTALVEAHRQPRRGGGRETQQRVNEFKDAVRPSPIPYYYEIIRARGIDCGDPRLPFLPVGNRAKATTFERLKQLGVPLGKS